MKVLFLHGWQSVPGGVKPTFLAQHGYEVINPKLPDEDFKEAVRIAQAEFDKHQPDVVVGSSRGGAVAMNINSGGAKLVLLCPAWKKFGNVKTPVVDRESMFIQMPTEKRLASRTNLLTRSFDVQGKSSMARPVRGFCKA